MPFEAADEYPQTLSTAPATDPAPLFVSLYVVLLAFFILLNSMSTFEQKKVAEVHEGIKKAFTVKKALLTPEILESDGVELSISQFFAETRELAVNMLHLWKVDSATTGNVMTLTLPVEAFFRPGQSRIRAESAAFIKKLTDTLSTWRQGLRIDIEFLIGYETEPGDAAGAENRLDIARAGSLSRELAASGLPAKSISGGLQQANPETIELRFSARAPEKTELKLSPKATP